MYLHAETGAPNDRISNWLRARYTTYIPSLRGLKIEGGILLARMALDCVDTPDVIIGASSGGSLALALGHRGHWKGPMVLLAPRGDLLPESERGFVPGCRTRIIHGVFDREVEVSQSRAWLREAKKQDDASLISGPWNHSLGLILEIGVLRSAIDWVRQLHISH